MKMLHALTLLASIYLVSAPAPVRAAESYDNCTAFITSLPATIGTQGTWCLNQDLSTAITSGNAITITTNNVTLDCNHFKLGGLAAGAGTDTDGVFATSKIGVTVRNCNIRGFVYGVELIGGANHVAENNAFFGNTLAGVLVDSVDSVVIRDNIFADTGGSTLNSFARAVEVTNGSGAIVSGNLITGVMANAVFPNGTVAGINATSPGAVISGNRISGVTANGTGDATGITLGLYGKSVDNIVDNLGTGGGSTRGLFCVATSFTRGTVTSQVGSFSAGICVDGGGNIDI